MNEPKYSTQKEICYHFQRSRNWLYALRRLGLPCYGNRYKFSDVEKFAQKYPYPLRAYRNKNNTKS